MNVLPVLLLLLAPLTSGDTTEVPEGIVCHEVLECQKGILIEKDVRSKSTRVHIQLPQTTIYSQYITKVSDISSEEKLRDAVRTFLASVLSSSVVNIHNLHPGHKYKITVTGRRDDTSDVLREEEVIMDPQAPDFTRPGASILPSLANITLRTVKPDKALQDSFLITYRQVSPEVAYPLLEITDIEDQRELEIYLGNLHPGRDYHISVVSVKDGITSTPWEAKVTTKPSKLLSVSAAEVPPSCVNLSWVLPDVSGVDHFEVSYGLSGAVAHKEVAPESSRSLLICDGITPGTSSVFSVTAVKSNVASTPFTIEHTMRPRAPDEIHMRADTWSAKYRVWAMLPKEGRCDGCILSVLSENLDRTETTTRVEQNATTCEFFLSLKPGNRYEFSLSTTSGNARSTVVVRSVSLPPAFDMTAFGLTVQESRGGLQITWPQSDVFMERMKEMWTKVVGNDSVLHVRVTGKGNKTRQFESSPFTLRPIFVNNLVQGACYKMQMYTVTRTGIVSDSRHDESMRISAPPVDVSLHTVSRASASLRLSLVGSSSPQPNPECQVVLNVLDADGMAVFDRRLPLPNASVDLTLEGLRPFHKYTVSTQVTCGLPSSACPPSSRTIRQLSFVTRQDRPGPVQSPVVRAINAYSVKLSWTAPALPNGVLTHYIVHIQPETGDPWSVNVGTGTSSSVEAVIDGLRGGHSYRFSIRAVTEAGAGDPPAASDAPNITMPINAPSRPNAPPVIVEESIGAHSVSVRLPPVLFDSRNGIIIRSVLLVSQVDDNHTTHNTTYTWAEVQNFDVWPTYTAIVIDETRTEEDPILIRDIGTDSCVGVPSHIPCNGPLKAASSYRIRVRLFTAPNLFTDSPSVLVTTGSAGSVGSWVLGSSLIAVLVAVIVLLALLVFTSRPSRRPSEDKESQWAALKMLMAERAADCLARLGLDGCQPTTTLQPGTHLRRGGSLRERVGVEHRLDGLPSLPKQPVPTIMPGFNMDKSRPVTSDRFAEHVRLMSADSDFRFSEEYEMLRNVGVGASCSAAESPNNRAKNRFTNILPYDHSRVKLISPDDVDGEDYINANYMPGYHSKREFIAAQGPLPSTRDAFWKMIMEQGCPCIVALTKCIEKGRDKCHQYWPDKDHLSVLYGDIEVTLLSETHTDDIIVRELRLTPMDGGKARTVTHMHYMAWPDFGVPDSPRGIVRFARLFRQKVPVSPQNKPTVVHCSAGVGRSGTFIALDRLLHTMADKRPLDVFGVVHEMRQERCHMVQNEQQYIFIHQCLLHVLMDSSREELQTHSNEAFDDDEGIAESGL